MKYREKREMRAPFMVASALLVLGGGVGSWIFGTALEQDLPAFVDPFAFNLLLAVMVEAILAFSAISWGSRLAGHPDLEGNRDVPSGYICNDGHKVRSRGEALVDNWLHDRGIEHEYEKTVILGGTRLKYDWYLPAQDIYIEYWGYYTREYKKRRKQKEKAYQDAGKRLISIENADIADLNTRMKEKLLYYMDEAEISRPKRCFNCGIELDDRY